MFHLIFLFLALFGIFLRYMPNTLFFPELLIPWNSPPEPQYTLFLFMESWPAIILFFSLAIITYLMIRRRPRQRIVIVD